MASLHENADIKPVLNMSKKQQHHGGAGAHINVKKGTAPFKENINLTSNSLLEHIDLDNTLATNNM